MSIKDQKGRTFLTKEEIAKRGILINSAQGLDQKFHMLGQIVTSFFINLDETKAQTNLITELDKEFNSEIFEKYGKVKITEEGEVLPFSEDEGEQVESTPSIDDAEVI